MANDRSMAVLPHIGAGRLGGLLCVVVLHVGAWYWIDCASPASIRTPPAARLSNEMIVRLYDSPPPRKVDRDAAAKVRRKAGRIDLPATANMEDEKTRPPPVTQSERGPAESEEVSFARTSPDEAAAPEAPLNPSSLHGENVGKIIRDIAAEDERKENRSRTALEAQPSAAEKAISRALRPKCENGDAAKAGNAQFTGLMKLPLLALGAVRDTGCKW